MTFIACARAISAALILLRLDKCCYLRGLFENGLTDCLAVSPR